MNKYFICILKGLKSMPLTVFVTYTVFMLLLLYMIDDILFYNLETIFEIPHKVRFYDIILLILWLFVYIHGFYLWGKYLGDE